MAGGEGEAEVPLLEKKPEVYFDGCPGCAMDRRKAENSGIPYVLLFHMWIINLVTCLPLSSIFPYLYFMAYAVEVCRPEHHAIGLSIVSTSWAVALIIGPAIGGYLAQPTEKYPKLFPANSFFGRFPYLLPCLCMSVFYFVILISCIWLPVWAIN
nr:unnamed protein product [Digitaria exilis]